MLAGEDQSQDDQPNSLAEGKKEERCALAMWPRALRKGPSTYSHQRGHLFLHPGHKEIKTHWELLHFLELASQQQVNLTHYFLDAEEGSRQKHG
eukprot:1153000-Pelagomonas_calceolata.AAC.5